MVMETIITINEFMEITKTSYPTALSFAKEHGEQETFGGQRARWFIPLSAVRDLVYSEQGRVDEMIEALRTFEAIPDE
jgi:hypothetical protein